MRMFALVAASCVLLSTEQVVLGESGAATRVESGELARGDERLDSGEFVDTYALEGVRRQRVRLELTTRDFDGYLMLVAPDGEQIENDDSDEDARVSVIETDLEQRGTYQVLVTSFEKGERGRYTLRISISGSADRQRDDTRPRAERRGGRTTTPARSTARLLGVFVGISDYEDDDNDLEYTADDARRLRQDLIRGAGMRAEDATLLVDSAATMAAFQRAVSTAAQRASHDDLLVIFFSGHGDRVQRTSPQAADPDGFDETLTFHDGELTDDELARLLGGVSARVLLVVDSCYSGGFSKDVISAPRRMGLFSSEEDVVSSVADEFRAGGYLATFMSEGVGGWRADGNRDGDITAIELSDYLHARYRADVAGSSPRTSRGRKSERDGLGDQHLVVDRGSFGAREVLLRRPRNE